MVDHLDQKLQAFFQEFPTQKYVKGDHILRAGSSGEHFYFIETGAVKMATTSAQGRNLVLTIFYPGACFSLLALVSKNINAYDFIAMTNTTVRKVPQWQLLNFLKENVDVLFEFQLRLLKGLQGLLHRIEQSTFVSAYHQVAGLLLYFERHCSVPTHTTHQEIAEWLGLTRENVSIQMKQLERDGLIEKNDKFVKIIDLKKLEQLADPYTLA